jgi:hypothetical protein
LFPVAKKKLAGKPQRFEEQKKGLIAPMLIQQRRLFFDEVSDNPPLGRSTSRVDFELARRRGFSIYISRPIGLVCRLAV